MLFDSHCHARLLFVLTSLNRPADRGPAGWRRAKSGESATARSAMDKGQATERARHDAPGGRRPMTVRRQPEKSEARTRATRSPLGGQGIRVPEESQWVPWHGPARRHGRGVSDGGRRPILSTGQNTVLPAHSGLRPPFTSTEERIRFERS